MNILVLIDSFKGSLSSLEAGEIIKKACEQDPSNKVIVKPVADGGEGTIDSLKDIKNARIVEVDVHNPLMEHHIARYLIVDDKLAIMEMSESSGLTLIKDNLDPMNATTFGVGDMIKDALDKNIREFIIGIGGSATTDGGMGMLRSLGARFFDEDGIEISNGPIGIIDLETIDLDNFDVRLKECTFQIACDVDNPLCGERGSARVFSPQKGATPKQVEELDKLLGKYHEVTKKVIPDANDTIEGAGAAGGLGYAFKNYLNAELKPGIEIILEMLGADELIKNSDLIITGEGKMDFQTSMGKTPVGIANAAKKYNKKVIAFCGVCDNDAVSVNDRGIDAFFPILNKCMSTNEAMDKKVSEENLYRSVDQVMKLINLWR
ncbi:glycerate kinase [Finegoldia magna]|uniref:glycerate kinase family protein n=1 Tax=Finegoldia magna TaxID=1260 RepID=UPI000B918D83|nr:glycerate kinase [Finegoldia magna]MDU1009657.1 glycerate kinase [Finegoldia magna]MDU1088030.1 glycerate kinase [Finegoldia magna]MDU4277490.1 glycerate kinase [Finegoldia magna]MDU5069926.1 glycerate kinase [Finegoldia magna]MDU7889845.1 glycerate kinase [Finegoldia magna]